VGRNVPEIDILEAQIDPTVWQGQASQSYQVAPYNYQYVFDNSTASSPLLNPNSIRNTYTGGVYQQALSSLTPINSQNYNNNGGGFGKYAFEWWSNPSHRSEGYITWFVDGTPSWKITAASLAGDSTSGISSRLISEEPMVCHIFYCTFYVVVH